MEALEARVIALEEVAAARGVRRLVRNAQVVGNCPRAGEIPPGPIRSDPASSDFVVVRHGGQVELAAAVRLVAYMSYQAGLTAAVVHVGTRSHCPCGGSCLERRCCPSPPTGGLSYGVGMACEIRD
jgi:hypothetical protein